MNARSKAAWQAHLFFTDQGIPYSVIGGIAVQYWGEPRFTQDIDLTISAPLDDLTSFIGLILDNFSPRIEDAFEFARLNRVILVKASNGYPLDITLGLPGYEHEVMARSVDREVAPGKAIRICSAEDLIIYKAIAGRAQDIRDIEGIVYRQGKTLNDATIRQWLLEFVELTGKQEIIDHFLTPWQKLSE